MGKFVFWVGVIALICFGIRLVTVLQRKAERQSEDAATREPGPDPAQARVPSAVPVMQCARCGVYLPDHEAIHAGSLAFCSEEHREAGPLQRPDDRS